MMKATIHPRHCLLGLFLLTATGCSAVNDDHCWIADGDSTCMALFGGGFCSSNHPKCEGHAMPYGCVFERPMTDECYSPTGNNASCAGPDPAPECAAVVGETGESGMSESSAGSESSDESGTSENPVCGDGTVEGDEECDDFNDDDTDECTNACTLPACGDGIVSPGAGEDCDVANTPGDEICTAECQLVGSVIWEIYCNIADVDDDVGYEVEIDPSDNIDILVGDGASYLVIQLSEAGALSWDVPLGPWGDPVLQSNLAVGIAGQVIVGGVSSDQGHVRQLESDGSLAGDYSIAPNMMLSSSAVLAVGADANGGTVVAGYNDAYVVLLGLDGAGQPTWEYESGAQGQLGPIAVGADGQIRVWQMTNGLGLLRLFDETGMILGPFESVETTDARAMSLDSSNNVYLLTQASSESYMLFKHDALLTPLWNQVRGALGAEEEANGVAALPGDGALVAGYIRDLGQPRGKLSLFSPEGEDILQLVIDEDAGDVDARLYDVAVSPDGDYAVAVGSRKVGAEPTKLWVRKFVI